MQGHHRSRDGARPRDRRAHHESGNCDHDRLPQARLFLCADPDCRAQVVICSDCDRGHIYCADCGPHARRRSLHAAGRRYQASHRGRVKHAERARRYRARQNKVTHHGSPPSPSDDLLPTGSLAIASGAAALDEPARRPGLHCHWCGRRCPDLVRQGFLRRRGHRRGVPRHDRTGHSHGDTT